MCNVTVHQTGPLDFNPALLTNDLTDLTYTHINTHDSFILYLCLVEAFTVRMRGNQE